MIDVIGYLKIDESKPERIEYLVACIRSYRFLALDDSPGPAPTITIALDNPSNTLVELVHKEVMSLVFLKDHANVIAVKYDPLKAKSYGNTYCKLIERFSKNDYIINFMEDQFMVVPNAEILHTILTAMRVLKTDVCKCSFFEIEINCWKNLRFQKPEVAESFANSPENHAIYQQPYGRRYWLGVNFITTKNFALRFWGRDCGLRPHDYELEHYDEAFMHSVLIPNVEIQAAIDDDHGEPNTSLLKRLNGKFHNIMQSINQQPEDTKYSVPLEAVVEEDKSQQIDETEYSWVTEDAMDILNAYMKFHNAFNAKSPQYGLRVLEFGMGGSTVWLSQQPSITYLVSIEASEDVYEETIKKITNAPAGYFGQHIEGFAHVEKGFEKNVFDLLLVRGNDRVKCVMIGVTKLKPGGLLVLDNSEKPEYENVFKMLSDWTRIECTQDKSDNYGSYYPGWQTTIFKKPI